MVKKTRIKYGNVILAIVVGFLLIYGLVSIVKMIFKDEPNEKPEDYEVRKEKSVLPEATLPTNEEDKKTKEYTFNIGDSFDEVSSFIEENEAPYITIINYVKEPKEGLVSIEGNKLYFERNLTRTKVRWLQEQLTKAGYPTAVDGGFGKKTKAALDKYTNDIMNQQFETYNSIIEESLELHNGVKSDDTDLTQDNIRWLQEQLKIAGYYTKIDGSFGKNTKKTLDKYTKEVMNVTFDSYNSKVKESLKEYNKDRLADTSNYYLMLVSKKKNILSTFKPKDLVEITAKHADNVKYIDRKANEALVNMFSDAKKEGINLRVVSGYRSFQYQVNLFDRYVKKDGFEKANKYSALPGQSEHQTGLAVDVDNNSDAKYTVSVKFEETDAFKWLQKNAYKYGFILRYPKGKEGITGYTYEPWHYRYIDDVNIAKEISANNMTLEEYLNE